MEDHLLSCGGGQEAAAKLLKGLAWQQSLAIPGAKVGTPVSYTSIGAMDLLLWVMWIPFTTSLWDEGLCCSLHQLPKSRGMGPGLNSGCLLYSHILLYITWPPSPTKNLMAHLLPFVHMEAETWISVCSFCPCPSALLVLLMSSCRPISLCSTVRLS